MASEAENEVFQMKLYDDIVMRAAGDPWALSATMQSPICTRVYEKFYDWTFNVLLWVSGIQDNTTNSVRLRQFLWLTFLVSAAITYTEIFVRSSSSSNPLTLSTAVNILNPLLSLVCVVLLLWNRRGISNFIRERTTRRSLSNFVTSLSTVLLTVVYDAIYVYFDPTTDNMKESCIEIIFLIPYATFFLTYFDSLRCVDDQLRELHRRCRGPLLQRLCLTVMKERIRKQVRTLNSHFAYALAIHFVQLATDLFYATASEISVDRPSWLEALSLMGLIIAEISVLTLAVRRASQVTEQCQTTFGHLSILCAKENSPSRLTKLWTLIENFRYDQDRDCPRVASWALTPANLMGFFLGAASFGAIVLQFDYKIFSLMSELAAHNVRSPNGT